MVNQQGKARYSALGDACRRPNFGYKSLGSQAQGDQTNLANRSGFCWFKWRKRPDEYSRALPGDRSWDRSNQYPQSGVWIIGKKPSSAQWRDPRSGVFPIVPEDVLKYGDGGVPKGRDGSPREDERTHGTLRFDSLARASAIIISAISGPMGMDFPPTATSLLPVGLRGRKNRRPSKPSRSGGRRV